MGTISSMAISSETWRLNGAWSSAGRDCRETLYANGPSTLNCTMAELKFSPSERIIFANRHMMKTNSTVRVARVFDKHTYATMRLVFYQER